MQKPIILRGRIEVESEDDVEIGQWFKKAGEQFKADDVLLEVISVKATFEVAPGVPGKLISILHSDGEIVSLDDPIALIETDA